MLIESLRSSSVLEVLKYADFDQFRHATRIVKAWSIPLQTDGFAAATAVVRLPGCQIHLQRTFPRIVDALLEGGSLVVFPTEEVVPIKVNGIDIDYPALALGRGAGGYRATEWRANTLALVVFNSAMSDRGWPQFENEVRLFRIAPDILAALQWTVLSIFDHVSRFPEEIADPLVPGSMREQVLETLDAAFASSAPVGLAGAAFSKQVRIVEAIDMLLETDPAAPLYSEALARECGVSVRTLHNVTIRFRGISLHQYLRRKRLWMVRQRLLTGDPALQVRSCALQFGFWHMGEFSAAYAALFGEVPSRTLARARGRAA
jgi:AraC family transcriptional regulator, ethanolamine operon transcriptional activator